LILSSDDRQFYYAFPKCNLHLIKLLNTHMLLEWCLSADCPDGEVTYHRWGRIIILGFTWERILLLIVCWMLSCTLVLLIMLVCLQVRLRILCIMEGL
jgi:hypothetical protein